MNRRSTILLSFAHPDDESFMAAGTAARYSQAGHHVALVCATRGEEGKAGDPPVCTREELPAVRTRELEAACRILGIAELSFLGYRDKELNRAPEAEAAGLLAAHIRRLRPAVVITFDPAGGNGHPDHIAISRLTTLAVALAANSALPGAGGPAFRVPRFLYTSNPTWYQLALEPGLAREARVDFRIDVRRYKPKKIAALKAHRSQHISLDRVFFTPDRTHLMEWETYRLADGPAPSGAPLPDLLAGL